MEEIKFSERITEDERKIRIEVFMDEQEFSTDLDNFDYDPTVIHAVLYADSYPAAAARLIPRGGGKFSVGRIAVRKDFRGKGFGEKITRALEEKAKEQGGNTAMVSAQCRAENFYKKMGYISSGSIYYEEYCRHIHMEKEI